ncbi:MAG: NFACT RNA binding domain-containing protein [Armatimonadota bacterium]|nr:NFACT RNA binding domain-containing protein [Armatimonadota bacterium]MDR7436777.1 NFACT RNA binding domain-containing protein [Armatimonadota bacterium]MDR7472724.1 NFACT RNA binding domain-containing protein [Armatimonadota bacterium]MDR7506985.1 NFACT RNA binding domain-containing protein [Armatimonadota bacterium]MDR7508846.1 NFACT RNA binding domain-containing protein [Armatimonadota bacterium]
MSPVTSLDSLVLAAVVADLRAALVGGRVVRVVQPTADEVALVVRSRAGEQAVLYSTHPRWARVHLVAAPGGGEPGDFVRLLRSRLGDARVDAVEQVPWERIVVVRCATAFGQARLIAELMGRHSALILEEDSVVRGCLPPVRSAVRPVVPGRPYLPPPPSGRPPRAWTAQDLEEAVGVTDPVAARLRAVVLGLGPATAQEICVRAGVDPHRPARSPEEIARVGAVLQEIADLVEGGRFSPTLYRQNGEPVGCTPFPYVSLSALQAEPVPTMSAAVEAVWGQGAAAARLEDGRAAVRRVVRAALERTERALARVRAALEEAGGAGRLREQGELLLAYAREVPAGASEAVLPDASGTPVRIPLDPALSAVDNARRLFARYARLRDALPHLRQRLQALEMDRDYLRTALALAEQAATPEDVQDLLRELAEQGYGPPARAPVRPRPPAGPRRYALAGGAVALVGRTGGENERLTFSVARPTDLWFHARGVPGAHVILQAAGRPSEEAIRQAAALAAYYSRARQAVEVAVDYTERRHVRKPPGARPGLVTYAHARTVSVRPAVPS